MIPNEKTMMMSRGAFLKSDATTDQSNQSNKPLKKHYQILMQQEYLHPCLTL